MFSPGNTVAGGTSDKEKNVASGAKVTFQEGEEADKARMEETDADEGRGLMDIDPTVPYDVDTDVETDVEEEEGAEHGRLDNAEEKGVGLDDTEQEVGAGLNDVKEAGSDNTEIMEEEEENPKEGGEEVAAENHVKGSERSKEEGGPRDSEEALNDSSTVCGSDNAEHDVGDTSKIEAEGQPLTETECKGASPVIALSPHEVEEELEDTMQEACQEQKEGRKFTTRQRMLCGWHMRNISEHN